jgi:glycosyltransferase involved in cell wall biosynthesis
MVAERRLRVLLSAYACRPGSGSEPYVGWQWAQQAVRYHDSWVLTTEFQRTAIETELAHSPVANLHFIFTDVPRWARWLRPGGRLHYLVWQLTALRSAKRAHRKHGFDVVHHVTYNSFELPGFLSLLGIPFVWGPLGGAQVPPSSLKRYAGSWSKQQLRTARKQASRLNPWGRYVARHAAQVLAINRDTETMVRRMGARNVIRELETAVILSDSPPERPSAETVRPFTVTWAGRVIAMKAPMLALDAFELLRAHTPDARLRIAGDGPLRKAVEQAVTARGLEDCVDVLGAVPRQEMTAFYDSGDVFLFTSLHDSSGNVLLESLAEGVPVVTLDHHGAAEIIDDQCGIKVPIQTADEVVRGLGEAMSELSSNVTLREQMSVHGRKRLAEVFNWEHKGELLREIYGRVAGDGERGVTPTA